MKNVRNATHWEISDELLSHDFFAEESEADLSAESFSWETDPLTLLEDLEEWEEDEDNFGGMF